MAMQARRKDSKGRALYDGEQQKKDGRYEFRYRDIYGVRRSVYSWCLTDSDKTPDGKPVPRGESLRAKERVIKKELSTGRDFHTASKCTLNQRFDEYIQNKINIKPSTKSNYIYMYNHNVRDTVGRMTMSTINYSVMNEFFNELIKEKGFKPNSVENIHTILNPVFDNAVYDGLIRVNPCCKIMKEIRSSKDWVSRKISSKDAISKTEQQELLDFVKNHPTHQRWYNILVVLLGTGMRVGECTGLTEKDCDFANGKISVNHTLIYRQWEDGKCGYKVMETPKTKKGIRTIPMFEEVKQALLSELEYRNTHTNKHTVIGWHKDWVFLNRFGTVMAPDSINSALERIKRDYDKEHDVKMPKITNHILRHTFCTRMMESGMNMKVLQEIMGHSNFDTTADIYTTMTEDFKQETLNEFQGKIYLG